MSARELRPEEFEHGKDLLVTKLNLAKPRLVIFTFKKTAEVLFGPIVGNGFIPDLALAGAPVFVMPGPYASTSVVDERLDDLRGFSAG